LNRGPLGRDDKTLLRIAFLARLIRARRTLVGTFTGYSALAMALALAAKGQVVTSDISAEWVDIARPYWDRAGVADKIEVMIGRALDTLKELENKRTEPSIWLRRA
jgi:predicted O-methyltransferase YrrM